MKVRPFLLLLLTTGLILLALGLGGWGLVVRQSPLNLQHRALAVPEAARFIPRNAPLSLHLLVRPDQLAAYARAVAPAGQRRQAAAAAERLRDGAFAAAGLDYGRELADWIGEGTSLAVLAPEGPAGPTGWLLALGSRDGEGARRFLQRFWQTRSLAGAELRISTYRGLGLISGRSALAEENAAPLATALVNDRLVLIASGRGVMEQALDVSQIDELNLAANPRLQGDRLRLGDGLALLTARPEALGPWLGIPAEIAADPGVDGLVAGLSPSGRALRLEVDLDLREALPDLRLAPAPPLLAEVRGPASSLLLVQDPAALVGGTPSEPPDPWQRLLGPRLRQALGGLNGPVPRLVLAGDHGPLLWAQQPRGWLLGTASQAPSTSQLEPVLSADGLVAAPLERPGVPLQVWTKLQARVGKGDPERLTVSVAGTRAEQNGVAWWGQGVAVLDDQLAGHLPPGPRLDQLAALGASSAPLQAALGPEPARLLLARWQPWRLLSGLAGSHLTTSIQGLSFSLEPEREQGDGAALRLHGRLELG